MQTKAVKLHIAHGTVASLVGQKPEGADEWKPSRRLDASREAVITFAELQCSILADPLSKVQMQSKWKER